MRLMTWREAIHQYLLNGTTGVEIRRARLSGADDVFADVAVSDAAGIDKVGTDGYCSPRHQTHCEPSLLELNGTL